MQSNVIKAGLWLLLACGSGSLTAQAPQRLPSSKLAQDIKKLNVLGNVLYMAAHPDDENTTFIGYMANEKLYTTNYLALTRGDGGQNLIGPQIREQLGIIRTQELLQARRIDGGRQYFSRANDFGFSKNPQEAFMIWEKEQLLADAVWVIRKVKPDVIVTRFPPDSRAGHGHHSASSILAEEAFDAAADPTRFPEQLKYVAPWQAKRLLWNISMWSITNRAEFVKNAGQYLKIDLGVYNPLLGKSYGELSAESRSMHKSQGFGSVGTRGTSVEYFQHTKGDKTMTDLFEGIDTSWKRVKGSAKIEQLVQRAAREFDPANPAGSVPLLLSIRTELQKLPDGFWKTTKLADVQELIKNALGLYLEVTAPEFAYSPGATLPLTVEAINRSSVSVSLEKIHFPFATTDSAMHTPLAYNQDLTWETNAKIPVTTPISQPYWLRKEIGYAGLFSVDDLQEIGQPENPPVAVVTFDLLVAGQPLRMEVPVAFKKKDPVLGEVYQPLVITPPVFATIAQEVYMFDTAEPRKVDVTVKAGKDNCSGDVQLALPEGWRSIPEKISFALRDKGSEQTVEFQLFPPVDPQEARLRAVVTLEGQEYDKSFGLISYTHIPAQAFFPAASAKAVKLNLVKKGTNIGYIMGAGDLIPQSLRQIGYRVSLLEDQDITPEKLATFDAVITGVRAYNTNERMKHHQTALLKYVENGGNLVVQYNTNMGLITTELGPYPFELTRDRITEETSEVRLIKPESVVLNSPNKITADDFNHWVQERGLYFPQNWDPQYEAIISSNDPNSPPLDGGILVARYGKGTYVYTSLSWFRELPAGVPGAYRLFVNLLSLGD
ncbi:PIG-L family deacetylase [Rhabdobacter roseus]|uniref:LmbE family N-acetylglucosaminyl deacetylase n=1 Tax=Rhabdobacter roseus TaxID=1655419 RepID=A0A840TS58_9BACT|nr:PIG-L family deacetylase [Rhabdobacter roseus]MBB5286781.1 LmbE family N-acetylglucosaminyl deacetylase [Rhabdobacter roseus]